MRRLPRGEVPDMKSEGDRQSWQYRALATLVLGIGLVAAAVYASQADPPWAVFASALMIAAASLAAGGLLGFLFGIPRTLSSDATPPAGATPEASASALGRIRANTNLEQISDWLTKIIVGVSLTQLGTIRSGAVRLFDALAPGLGGGEAAAAFAGAIVVYFAVVGFLLGWLLTRLLLGRLMAKADQAGILLVQAAKAEAEGEPDKAEDLRAKALALQTSPLATRYEAARTLPRGVDRTADMEATIRTAKEMAPTSTLSPDEARTMFERGTDGERIVAIGLMQGNPALASFDAALGAITGSRSAFEQYHALLLVRDLLPSLDDDQRRQLATALQEQMSEGGHITPGSDRWTIARVILKQLGES
ncbi:MAG: hypothetical protein ACRDHU_08015 [Actinomycetota bacterium]